MNILAVLLLSLVPKLVTAYIKLDLHRSPETAPLLRRDSINVPLAHYRQIMYYANLTVGTPPQPFSLHLDTGSSDTWVPADNSNYCSGNACSKTGSFRPYLSSTFKLLKKDAFDITYADHDAEFGDYFSDVANVGGKTLDVELGLVKHTEGMHDSSYSGILGLGFGGGETGVYNHRHPRYPTLLERMKDTKQIGRLMYSLWLNDLESKVGSILFGAFDRQKYLEPLVSVPISKVYGKYNHLAIPLASWEFQMANGTKAIGRVETPSSAVLDSGSTFSYLPAPMMRELASLTSAMRSSLVPEGMYIVPCNVDKLLTAVTFRFGGVVGPSVRVLMSELIGPEVGLGYCQLLAADPLACLPTTLGDSFLRSAYVVYDLEDHAIALANARFDSSSEDIVQVCGGGLLPGVYYDPDSIALSRGTRHRAGQVPISSTQNQEMNQSSCYGMENADTSGSVYWEASAAPRLEWDGVWTVGLLMLVLV